MNNKDKKSIKPYNLEAEQAVLGAILLDNRVLTDIQEIVGKSDFHEERHQLLFEQMVSMMDEGRAADLITLAERLTSIGKLDRVGGVDYLATIMDATPGTSNARHYAHIVHERADMRDLLSACQSVIDTAGRAEGIGLDELVAMADSAIFNVTSRIQSGSNKNPTLTLKQALVQAMDRFDKVFNSDHRYSGLPTGYIELDGLTQGLHEADFVVVAGRPSMGKTTFAMNIVENIVKDRNVAAGVFSMEMPAEQLAVRFLSSWGGIDQRKLRTVKDLDDHDWSTMTVVLNDMQSKPIYIDETPGLNITDIRARARRMKRDYNIQLIVIDYLQLIRGQSKTADRNYEIGEISRSLKELAKELGIPVIALSQLNRSLEKRPDKRPVMSDLRESGAIEQDADLIVFIYRDEVYHPDTVDKGVAEIIIGKQRNGPLGTARLAFEGHLSRFKDFIPLAGYE